jgi:hypothetical protein
MLRRSLFWALGTFLAVLLLVSVGRSLLDSLLVRFDEAAAVHRDRSRFTTGVASQVPPDVVIVFRNEDGKRTRVLADAADYSAFARAAFARLEAARARASSEIPHDVTVEFMPLEAAAHGRVPLYADWYFAWGTTYRLLYEAAKSSLQHALAPSVLSLQASVAADVGAYIRRHYEERVLEPEISDALLRQAFARAYRRAHAGYLGALADLDQAFQRFVTDKTTHLDDGAGEVAAAIVVDWDSQLRKLKLSTHEKGGLGAIAGASGVAALAVLGAKAAALPAATKAVSGTASKGGGALLGAKSAALPAATKALTGASSRTGGALLGAKTAALPAAAKALGGASSKTGGALLANLSTRLAAPIASKAVASATSAGTGAAAGTAVGGPLGGALGALAGIGFDFAVNETVELVERPEFEAEVHRAVAATYGEWRDAVARSLEDAVTVWFDDTVQLLGPFDRLRPAPPERTTQRVG